MTRSYERIASRLLIDQPKPAACCTLVDGRLLTGTQSLHLTRCGRIWRLFWRIKSYRKEVQP